MSNAFCSYFFCQFNENENLVTDLMVIELCWMHSYAMAFAKTNLFVCDVRFAICDKRYMCSIIHCKDFVIFSLNYGHHMHISDKHNFGREKNKLTER